MMKTGIQYIIRWSIALLIIPSWTWAQAPQSSHEVFLIGDAGKPKAATHNLKVLKSHLESAGENATLIFLGDNVYKDGLPDKDHSDRALQEEKLLKQLEITKNFKGKTIVIPGNHDWDHSGKEGWDRVRNQTKFVKKYFDSKEVFFPKNGKPGPEEIQLDEGLYLIVIDWQWILHQWEKPLTNDVLVPHKVADILHDLYGMMEAHKNDHVILAAHHPMYSYGPHGGKYNFKSHLFPLTAVNPSLYIPLPVIGSIYPVYRSTAGSLQDIPHPKYKAIRNTLEDLLAKYPNTVYVSGHEHSLQHIQKNNMNYIVSGSGSKVSYLKEKGKYLQFGKSRRGFGKVSYKPSGNPELEFWAADEQSPSGEKIYTSGLYTFRPIAENFDFPRYSFEDTVQQAHASSQYRAGNFKQKMMGVNYRDVWETKIKAPIFNITEEKGGLKIIKKGGGYQTNSLRMQAADGKQYVLRSLEKYPERALPEIMKGTLAVNIVQDQMSASNPYGAFVVPPMAEAVGIYHTNPKLVYIPNDGAFGRHRKTFANTLALYEERPAFDWSDASFFGNSNDVVNSAEVLEKTHEDNDFQVDQTFTLRNRLFDMVIADWDRHEDQWRWASFDQGKGKLYRPIPRDRDQTFYLNEGWFPKFASRKWAMPRVEGFNDDVRWAPGFNFNARHFDRWFLNETTRADWQKMALEVKGNLSDEVIEKAIGQWPKEIYEQIGERTARTLKARRDNLPTYTLEHYESLAREVEVLGSDKKELFLIESLSTDQLKLSIHKISKSGDKKQITYQRIFESNETKELRIYGLDDDDEFKISGSQKNKILVRIIGGDGTDKYHDLTTNKAAGNIKIYDNESSSVIETAGPSFKSKLSNKKNINKYHQYSFKYDQLMPLIYGAVNPDDGLFIGGGALITKHGWRKDPYKAQHTILANIALATAAFNVKYTGNFTEAIGKWHLGIGVDIRNPKVNNFFGLGNESIYDVDTGIDFYRIRQEGHIYDIKLSRNLGNKGLLSLGLRQRTMEIQRRSDSYISSSGFSEFDTSQLFEDKRHYGGPFGALIFDTRDEKLFPTRGLFWNTELAGYRGWNENASDFAHFHSNIAFYYSFQYPARVTLASRTGYAHNFGELSPDEFYNANTLGGRSNLRGFRRTRFYGKTSFYQNVDLRLKLFDFSSVLFPGKFGIHGFYDIGRVWTDVHSDTWHKAAGAGVWVAPLSKASISLSYAFSPEEDLISLDLGFFF
ncbi:BamA/TamA family outer membrane protein [Reichenbachiella sp.]|uniref:BamA/TamA family outer membrane protein n=1 Tax=Reichenbachiella sp. TaxID=2184521 RepID=UPI0032985E28